MAAWNRKEMIEKFVAWQKMPEGADKVEAACAVCRLNDDDLNKFLGDIDQFVASFLDGAEAVLFGSPLNKKDEEAFFDDMGENARYISAPSVLRNGLLNNMNNIHTIRGDAPLTALKNLIYLSLSEKQEDIKDRISSRSAHDNNHSLSNPNVTSGGNVLGSLSKDTIVTKKMDNLPNSTAIYKKGEPIHPYILFMLVSSEEDKKLFAQRQETLSHKLDKQIEAVFSEGQSIDVAARELDVETKVIAQYIQTRPDLLEKNLIEINESNLNVTDFVMRALISLPSRIDTRDVRVVSDHLYDKSAQLIRDEVGIDMNPGAVKTSMSGSNTMAHRALINFALYQTDINAALIPATLMDPDKIKVSDDQGANVAFQQATKPTERGPGNTGKRTGPGPGPKSP